MTGPRRHNTARSSMENRRLRVHSRSVAWRRSEDQGFDGVVCDVLALKGERRHGATRGETKDEVRHGWGSAVPFWRE